VEEIDEESAEVRYWGNRMSVATLEDSSEKPRRDGNARLIISISVDTDSERENLN
jgi:hypothetical protein